MALKDELANRWGILLGLTAGGVTWALLPLHGFELAAAPLVGAAVWVTRATLATLDRGRARRPQLGPAPRLPVDQRAEEGRWLARARRAAGSFDDLARAMPAGPLAELVSAMSPQVAETVRTLERLAGQATAAGRALAHFDERFLAAEATRLTAARANAAAEVAEELDRSLASVAEQRQVLQRLSSARGGVLARLESGTLGLESLVARLVELSAMAAAGTAGDSTAGVTELTDELEGIRQGLAETEEVSRQALRAYQRSAAPAPDGT